MIVLYLVGVVLYLGWQVAEGARGQVELNRTTLWVAITWPLWVGLIIVVVLAAFFGVAIDGFRSGARR